MDQNTSLVLLEPISIIRKGANGKWISCPHQFENKEEAQSYLKYYYRDEHIGHDVEVKIVRITVEEV